MNKKISKIVSGALLAGALTTSVNGADTQFGVGAGISGQSSALIRGIVKLDNDLRLEPYIAFAYQDRDNQPSTTDISVGSAIHLIQSINTNLNGYYGGYIGITDSDTSGLGTNFNLGPVAGVEYAFDPKFTLGAEVRLDLGMGDTTSIGTSSSVLVRYYF